MPRSVRTVLLALMVVVLPTVTLYLISSVVFGDGALFAPLRIVVPTLGIVAVYLGWVAFQAALMLLLPGRTVQGMPLADGRTLTYRTNGLAALSLTLAAGVGPPRRVGWIPPGCSTRSPLCSWLPTRSSWCSAP
ncbi:MAG TPA: hypothetical protein VGK67_37170 [Myxococcales bacterium]|jgi:hypothetical protein